MSDTVIDRAIIAVRLSSPPDGIRLEIESLVRAAIDDLERQNVNARNLCPIDAHASEVKPLVLRAVCFYVQANFGVGVSAQDKAIAQASYDSLSGALSLSKEYMKEGSTE